MSRPSKLTNEIIEAVSTSVLHGASFTDSVVAAGVKYDTANEWFTRGEREGKGLYFQFFQKITQSQATCAVNMVRVIQQAAAKGEYRAALEWLKRRRREDWGDAVDVTSGGEKIVISIKGFDDIPED
jgi:hypothetical protein